MMVHSSHPSSEKILPLLVVSSLLKGPKEVGHNPHKVENIRSPRFWSKSPISLLRYAMLRTYEKTEAASRRGLGGVKAGGAHQVGASGK
eukprot:scaffold561_cov380-Pavlova_lutheri.AAC.12